MPDQPQKQDDTASTAFDQQARLVVLSTGRVFPLMAQHIIVGRETQNFSLTAKGWPAGSALALPDLKVTKRHAVLRERQGTFTVEDLNAFNKTALNGVLLTPYQEYPLNHGDILRFGDTEMRFELSREQAEK
jgi:pSer/pThr/pTyr-binding forkhead associated (FHA) protein